MDAEDERVILTPVPPAELQSLNFVDAVEPEAVRCLEASHTPTELGDVLERLCANSVLSRLIDRLLDSDSSELVKESYRHPNGFDKIVLAIAPSGHKIVIHCWAPGPGGTAHRDGNLHNHRWHFATRVLTGSYNFTEFEPGDPDDERLPLYHEHCYAAGPAGRYSLEPVGPCRLAATRSKKLRAGDTYLLPSAVIHHIEMDHRLPTVTLFVQGPAVSESTRVFSPAPLSEAGQVNPPRFDVSQYRGRLLAIRDLICAR